MLKKMKENERLDSIRQSVNWSIYMNNDARFVNDLILSSIIASLFLIASLCLLALGLVIYGAIFMFVVVVLFIFIGVIVCNESSRL